jgi:hypothetical protein
MIRSAHAASCCRVSDRSDRSRWVVAAVAAILTVALTACASGPKPSTSLGGLANGPSPTGGVSGLIPSSGPGSGSATPTTTRTGTA